MYFFTFACTSREAFSSFFRECLFRVAMQTLFHDILHMLDVFQLPSRIIVRI